MEIIIGRDTATGKLRFTVDGKDALYGEAKPLPQSVLPAHCVLTLTDESLRIRNLDINNLTFVNGQCVESKALNRGDRIELGADRYPLSWQALQAVLPADIRQLAEVWNTYENENIRLQIAERKFNTLRSTTGLITMIAIALSIATGGRSVWYVALYAIAIVISLVFFIKAYLDSSKMPQKRQELSRQFQRDYVCPHCGHFLGNQSYELLAQNSHCPYCKTKFIH